MSRRANAVNRLVLTVLGLLLLASGGLGLALGLEAFGARRAASPVLPQEVSTFAEGRPWFWWVVVAVLLLTAGLALLWLLIQLKPDRTTRLDRTTDAQDGYTTLHAGALTDAVEDEALSITGVSSASANVHERRGLRVVLHVELTESADIDQVRTRLEDEVVAHLREGVGDPGFPVSIELRPGASRKPQRSVA
jgi:hypothetical protein